MCPRNNLRMGKTRKHWPDSHGGQAEIAGQKVTWLTLLPRGSKFRLSPITIISWSMFHIAKWGFSPHLHLVVLPKASPGELPQSRSMPLCAPPPNTHTLLVLQTCVPSVQHAIGTSVELWHLYNIQGAKLLMGQNQALSRYFHGLLVQSISLCVFRLNSHSLD